MRRERVVSFVRCGIFSEERALVERSIYRNDRTSTSDVDSHLREVTSRN